MQTKLHEEDIYTHEGLDAYQDDDEINPVEEAFMMGYIEA